MTLPAPTVPSFFRLVDPAGDWSVGANGNFVRNGSFEEFSQGFYPSGELGAWDLRIGAGSANAGVCSTGAYSGANATDGRKLFDMGMGGYVYGNSFLQQRLSLVAGRHYTLSFDWGSEYNLGTTFTVTVGNLSAELADPAGSYGNPWIQHSSAYTFTAQGGDILTFTQISSDYWGLVLDNVRVVASP
jgi:hypothetical protein